MTTRRDVLQITAGAVLTAIGAGNPQDSLATETIKAFPRLTGRLVLLDPEAKTLLMGSVSFSTNDAGQVAVSIQDNDGARKERLVATRESSSVDMTQFLEAIHRVFDTCEV